MLNHTLETLKNKGIESSTLTMLNNYFFDMQKVLKNCFEVLKDNGFCFIVVGNSCYKGVPIQTDEILAQEAQKLGFECKEIIIARKLKTSSQQMKVIDSKAKFYLRREHNSFTKGEIMRQVNMRHKRSNTDLFFNFFKHLKHNLSNLIGVEATHTLSSWC